MFLLETFKFRRAWRTCVRKKSRIDLKWFMLETGSRLSNLLAAASQRRRVQIILTIVLRRNITLLIPLRLSSTSGMLRMIECPPSSPRKRKFTQKCKTCKNTRCKLRWFISRLSRGVTNCVTDLTISAVVSARMSDEGWNSVSRATPRDRSRPDDAQGGRVTRVRAPSARKKIRGDATSNYRPSAGVVRGRVYRFKRVGREK